MIKIKSYDEKFENLYYTNFKKLEENIKLQNSLNFFFDEKVEVESFLKILISKNFNDITFQDKKETKMIKLYYNLKNHIINGNTFIKEYEEFCNTHSMLKNRIFKNLFCKYYIKRFDNIIKEYIKYDKITDKNDFREKILKQNGLQVCPYCNKNTIDFFEEDDNRKKSNKSGIRLRTTGDLDHVLNKHNYPLFALSLYNFVPSCLVCNRTFKGDDSIDLLNPYIESFDSYAKFCIDEEDTDKWIQALDGNIDTVKLKININTTDDELKKKIDNNIKKFRLNKIYNCCSYVAVDLLYKKHKIPKETIINLFNDGETINLNNVEKERFYNILIYGFDFTDDEQLKKPYAKLARDLIK